MATIFDNLDIFRVLQNTETDFDGPNSDETKSQIRENLEHLLLMTYSTGVSGTITTDPPDDATGLITDSGASFTIAGVTTPHNFIFLDGNARGNNYTIDLISGSTLACTGDNVYADGARSGDRYHIFHDLKTNYGHDHDGLNSKSVVLGDSVVTAAKIATDAVTQIKLKTSDGSVNQPGATYGRETLPGGAYAFYPQIKMDSTSNVAWEARILTEDTTFDGWTTYATMIALNAGSVGRTIYARTTYITASGDVHWIFQKREKATGKIVSSYQAPDHPCFGNGNRPSLVQHPWVAYDNSKYDIIVINPTADQVEDAIARKVPIVGGGYLTAEKLKLNNYKVDGERPERDLLEVFADDFELIENKNADWPDIPITVGLPTVMDGKIVNDYRYGWIGQIVKPIRVPIKKPDYITPLGIKLKP